jgi:hypothetical protein
MAATFTFDGALLVTKDGGDERCEFVPFTEAGRLAPFGIPADRASGSCSLNGSFPPGIPTSLNCSKISCTGSCSLKSSTFGSTTSYWCECS